MSAGKFVGWKAGKYTGEGSSVARPVKDMGIYETEKPVMGLWVHSYFHDPTKITYEAIPCLT